MEQYYRLPQDVVGHDPQLLSYWDQLPARAQLRLLESTITVSTLGELQRLGEELGRRGCRGPGEVFLLLADETGQTFLTKKETGKGAERR